MSTIITKRQFPHYHKYTMDLAGRPLTLEVGKLAELENGCIERELPPYGAAILIKGQEERA